MFKLIAVPLDGSAFGDSAIPYAAALARRSGAKLELLHVHRTAMPGASLEPLPQYRFQGIATADDAADADALGREEERLEEIARMLDADFGVAATGQVLRGAPADALVKHVQAAGTDLVVMATHAEGGAVRAWRQSTADAVVRNSCTPVLLVRPGARTPPPEGEVEFRRILVPVDGSSFSETALGVAEELADSMEGVIDLLYVADPSAGHWPQTRGGPDGSTQSALDYLDGLAPKVKSRGAVTTRVLTDANPAHAILEAVAEGRYDLVAMATHGRGGLRPLLVGSTADEVLRGAHVPVLLFCPG